MQAFTKFTFMKWMNICVIMFFVNFNFQGKEGFEFIASLESQASLPLFQGSYYDFTVQWYFNIGTSICLTLAGDILTAQAGNWIMAIVTVLRRLYDRGFKCDLQDKKSLVPE